MNKLIFVILIFELLFPPMNVNAESEKEITVSAAISLKNVFEEISKLYELRHKGVRVMFNFGASVDLVRQIEGGASD
jgi:molybdate transport system substrate-binding protein